VRLSPGELLVYFRLADGSEFLCARLRHGKKRSHRVNGRIVPLD
jgi:hypothetical protein